MPAAQLVFASSHEALILVDLLLREAGFRWDFVKETPDSLMSGVSGFEIAEADVRFLVRF